MDTIYEATDCGNVFWLPDGQAKVIGYNTNVVPDNAVFVKPISVEIKDYYKRLSALHESLILELLDSPSYVTVSGWSSTLGFAQRYLAGDRSDEVLINIRARLNNAEASMPNDFGLTYWSLLVTTVKAPFANYAYSLAEGVLRRSEERVKGTDLSSIADIGSYIKQETELAMLDAVGDKYDSSISVGLNLQNGNVGGVLLQASLYLTELKTKFMSLISAS